MKFAIIFPNPVSIAMPTSAIAKLMTVPPMASTLNSRTRKSRPAPKNILINCFSRFFIISPAITLFFRRQPISALFLSPTQIRRLFGGCGNKPKVSFFHSTEDAPSHKMIGNGAGRNIPFFCRLFDCYIIRMLHLFSWKY